MDIKKLGKRLPSTNTDYICLYYHEFWCLLHVGTIDIRYTQTMTQIEIKKLQDFPEGKFEVTVKGNRVTKHKVTVNKAYYTELTSGAASPEELVEKSFEFLLTRESNTSILSEFNLKVIPKYFSGYEREIKSRF